MKNRGVLSVLIAALLFGFIGILNKLLPVPPIVQNFYRFLFSAVVLLAVVGIQREKISLKKKSLPLLVLVSMGIIGSSTLVAVSVKMIPVGTTIFLFYIFPIIAVLLSSIFLKEKLSPMVVLSLVLATVGIFFISKHEAGQSSNLLGYFYALAAAFCYAVVLVISKKLRLYYSATVLATFQALLVILFLLPFTLVTNYHLTINSLIILLFLGVVISSGGIILLNSGLGKISASKSAIFMYIEPVSASILALVFFKQIPSLFVIIGCVFILLADYLAIIESNSTEIK